MAFFVGAKEYQLHCNVIGKPADDTYLYARRCSDPILMMKFLEMTMYSKSLLAAAIVACIALPATAQTFFAENRVEVTPLKGSSFQVGPDSGFGVPGQWCAAADYARRVLGVPWASRLYVQGIGTAKRSIIFGPDPAGAQPSRITVVSRSAKTPGANFSVQRAYGFCIDQRVPIFERR